MSGLPTVEREQVLAFRLQGHALAQRLPAGSLLAAAGACGIQNTPPGSAALALHARVSDLTPGDLDRALAGEKTLLQVWSLRASPYVVPTRDAAIFTAGLLPEDEASLRFFIRGAGPYLDLFGLSADEIVARVAEALPEVLDGRELTKDELGAALAQRLSEEIPPEQVSLWNAPDGLTHYGETLVRFALSLVALQGRFCFAPWKRGAATFVLTDPWLGAPLPASDPSRARAELVRRYLSCYGPSTPGDFAEWAGIAPDQAHRAWQLVEADLVDVRAAGRKAWLNGGDLPRLQAPVEPRGVRFLPPHDPYLLARDRKMLLPDKALHPLFWRTVGNPGAVLVDGRLVAAWRPQKKGTRLRITIYPLGCTSNEIQADLEVEAALLAPFRGCTSVEVVAAEIE